ncbi:MAG: hypothetical protein HOO91_06610 [Bacteroidales bacterium]|nr:hypothetical protein [Bacteroidales bacterium]
MKKIIYFTIAATLFFGCKKNDREPAGSVWGVIINKNGNEYVQSASVQIDQTGRKTFTGSDGRYEFKELNPGEYTLNITKAGYIAQTNYKIVVIPGINTEYSPQLEKLPPSLRIINDKGDTISVLNFGSAAADITRLFNIYNDGLESLEWQITKTAIWIPTVSKTEGTLEPGLMQAVVVIIDREKLIGGDNITNLYVTSNNGSKELKIKATGAVDVLPPLSTFDVTNLKANAAVFNGQINNTNSPPYTERGFVYSASSMPTLTTTIAKITAEVTLSSQFSKNVTDLIIDQKYFVRAYAINSLGTAYSTNEVSFTTRNGKPVLTTTPCTNLTTKTITSGGNITDDGGLSIAERGICWNTMANPTIDIIKTSDGSGTGSFTSNIIELTPNTKYFVRAYATNSFGTVYGNEISITTKQIVTPTLNTSDATSITTTTAITGGNLTEDGGATITQRGICYSTTQIPTTASNIIFTNGTTGAFTCNLTGLTPGIKYYARAYAINSAGTGYGNEISFTTTAIVLPTVITNDATAVTTTTVMSGGNVTNDGNAAITERGICYSTTPTPTTANIKLVISGTMGLFTCNLPGLTSGLKYYARAYATNSAGTGYGKEINFTTFALVDNDKNYYNAITIGTQTWMKENLKTTKYRDSSTITHIADNTTWTTQITGAYCWYDNDINNKTTYGALYNFYTMVDNRNLCPTGWHVPTDTEWTTLTDYLGGESMAGGELKAISTLWNDPNTGANNSRGFTAFPGGYRREDGSYYGIGNGGYWWSGTEAWDRKLYYDQSSIGRYDGKKGYGLSVRCVKD